MDRRVDVWIRNALQIANKYNNPAYPIVHASADISNGRFFIYEILKRTGDVERVRAMFEPCKCIMTEAAKVVLEQMVEEGIEEYASKNSSHF